MLKILTGQFIDKNGIQCLKDYKYKGSDYTILDKAFQGWWEFFVSLIPLSVAPNVLTLLALVFTASAIALELSYDTTMTAKLPVHVHFYAVFCLFWYQTLDAVDGKQARRTKTSSPLGQLFDHGCDGINTIMFIILLWSSFERGADWAFFVCFAVFTLAFFIGQWEEQHTHVLRTSCMGVGVTECKSTS